MPSLPTLNSPRTQVQGIPCGAALCGRHPRPLQPPRVQPQPRCVLLKVVELRVLQATAQGNMLSS